MHQSPIQRNSGTKTFPRPAMSHDIPPLPIRCKRSSFPPPLATPCEAERGKNEMKHIQETPLLWRCPGKRLMGPQRNLTTSDMYCPPAPYYILNSIALKMQRRCKFNEDKFQIEIPGYIYICFSCLLVKAAETSRLFIPCCLWARLFVSGHFPQ